jgi:hypothetical protein
MRANGCFSSATLRYHHEVIISLSNGGVLVGSKWGNACDGPGPDALSSPKRGRRDSPDGDNGIRP